MSLLEIFDPPMCCSTGVCGPSADPALARFAADLSWLEAAGHGVERHNLSQEPGLFASSRTISELLQASGVQSLPAVLVDGSLVVSGRYPTRGELRAWLSIESSGALDDVGRELVAVGASIVSGSEESLKFHLGEARVAGATPDALGEAVRIALEIAGSSAGSTADLAYRLIEEGLIQEEQQISGSALAGEGQPVAVTFSRGGDSRTGCC